MDRALELDVHDAGRLQLVAILEGPLEEIDRPDPRGAARPTQLAAAALSPSRSGSYEQCGKDQDNVGPYQPIPAATDHLRAWAKARSRHESSARL